MGMEERCGVFLSVWLGNKGRALRKTLYGF